MNGPSLKFIGHAGFLLTYNGVTLVCDPWVSDSGAFLHSWHQYPPNDAIDREALLGADYLYISHPHNDHFDREFLRTLPKHRVTVVIADFISDSLATDVAALGFTRIVKLKDWRRYELADDFAVTIFKDPSLYKMDSALLIQAGATTILDKNDCHIGADHVSRFSDYGIDVLFGQFSGAGWYPAVYRYEREKESRIAEEIKRNLLDSFVEAANGVGARHVMHCAGPPCFLEDEFSPLNFDENGIFHDQRDVFDELARRLNGKLHLLLPGDALRLDSAGEPQVTTFTGFNFSDKRRLLQEYSDRRTPAIRSYLDSLPDPADGFVTRFEAYLTKLFASSSHVRKTVHALVEFRLTGTHAGSVYVDTRSLELLVSRSHDEKPNYVFVLASRVANLLVEGEQTWEELLLSMRFSASREPDVYNWPLFAILRYGQDPKLIAQVERVMRESAEETFVVESDGKTYRVQRYCPHAGEDLSYAKLSHGRLICRRHQWTFDLHNGGQCVFGGSVPLKISELRRGETEASLP